MNRFRDRREAGRAMARRLGDYPGRPDVLVLALPRGGVPVAYEIARALHAPLDVFLVRKLGVPGHEELAMGAIATGGVRVLNPDVVRPLGIPDSVIETVAAEELHAEADEVVCARAPSPFYSVGQWYEDFTQTSDEEVHDLLGQAADGDEVARAAGQRE